MTTVLGETVALARSGHEGLTTSGECSIARSTTRGVAIVGARWDDDNCDASGSAYAYVFEDVGVGCLVDLDCDGFVGINDLLILLVVWGPNPGHPADFDGDGIVGVGDMLAMFANWGPCPE